MNRLFNSSGSMCRGSPPTKTLITSMVINASAPYHKTTTQSVIGIVPQLSKKCRACARKQSDLYFQYWYDLYPAVLDLLIN